MSGRLLRLILAIQFAATAACAAGALVSGSSLVEGAAAGMFLGMVNLAAVAMIFRGILAPGASTGAKVLRAALAAAKFLALVGLFYLAVVRAGMSPAGLAAGFTASLFIPIVGVLIPAVREARAGDDGIFKRAAQCRTE